ncbi:hypothetical protein M1105_03955 [Limibaculum sp. FT325]|uniref:hypothetical protein n=1 Tax=Thermohalobaculum sediminis TaxID=2939436 RepID=UPI0020BE7390|nr:hypothetical protein [Limibaculum sediminis]MCL5776146.1 hypothetical protein [Limibaculum sediminis]
MSKTYSSPNGLEAAVRFCELSRACVFTVEYSVRSAWTAVHGLTGSVAAPPSVVRSDRDPGALLMATRVLFSS